MDTLSHSGPYPLSPTHTEASNSLSDVSTSQTDIASSHPDVSYAKLDMSAIRIDMSTSRLDTSSSDSITVTSPDVPRDQSLVHRMQLLSRALCDVSTSASNADDVTASKSLDECVVQFEQLEQEMTQYFALNQSPAVTQNDDDALKVGIFV